MVKKYVVVSSGFDDLRSREVRFLQEASKLGKVRVCLWSDRMIENHTGQPPKFPFAERLYFVQSIRFVDEVVGIDTPHALNELPQKMLTNTTAWVDDTKGNNPKRLEFCKGTGIEYKVIRERALKDFPKIFKSIAINRNEPRVIVTGCYDWLHSGHVRFFEEAAAYGKLYVAIGNDENVRMLKGEGHPLFNQQERLYMVSSIRYVYRAMITTGKGWLDAEPEIKKIKPTFYIVNEDGDKPEKREYCLKNNIRYIVLKRKPKEGLPRRQSTDLRGF
ncbi:MAG: adenylyltransferase/cytidyltransferase family protein [Verrucomicrobiia bacterium]